MADKTMTDAAFGEMSRNEQVRWWEWMSGQFLFALG